MITCDMLSTGFGDKVQTSEKAVHTPGLSCLHRSDSSCVRCSFLLRSLSAHARHRSFFLTLFAHRNVGLSLCCNGSLKRVVVHNNWRRGKSDGKE